MNIFTNTAWASVNANPQGNPYSLVIMLTVFAGIFYFMIFRPQQKRNKIHKELLRSISKGDEILTNGGLVGRVVKVTETGYIFVILNDRNDTSDNAILIKRDCVTAILPKGTMKAL
ncbi:preprotein translocase subunit YajC [Blochmannia endosymbiont of Camponotus sp.]|uniref:preprotein translocase subunit YajC n=1 Tax=Blochmannia endosymbiont of Camponotus sp. TaxID=700220 RepID=UPI0020240712|nr:preprotein translocase subunit YajC [Blochmannia endosymbiont of Camponotus sp.]URJ24140.1 preprotein translocase subunit YajC [Blochmannia endosymbiont of Camponotus sp.]URJ25667.1 preprotein translocase subunit YajC [Blochmannia endosymbiont of Camponotus sp.]URJ32659.1 preprotein translocase subunit YajC [Blochmannia endosymbiont of Camponotus sp.]